LVLVEQFKRYKMLLKKIPNCCYSIKKNFLSTNYTVIVLGAPRGGTSMVAGVLRQLGVFMGDHVDESSNEDLEFLSHGGSRELFSYPSDDLDEYISNVAKIISARNENHAIWGWKDPLSSLYLEKILNLIRNPLIIWITRDPIAVTERELIEEFPETVESKSDHAYAHLKNTCDQYGNTALLLAATNTNTLLVSYERSLHHPESFYKSLTEFIEIDYNENHSIAIKNYIKPDRKNATINPNEILESPLLSLLEKLNLSIETTISEDHFFENINSAINKINSGKFLDGKSILIQLLAGLAQDHTILHKDPGTIISEIRSIKTKAIAESLPDCVVEIYYLMGLCEVNCQEYNSAALYFAACHDIARRRLYSHCGEIDKSIAYVSLSKYHEGFCGKLLEATSCVDECLADLRSIRSSLGLTYDAVGADIDKIISNFKINVAN
jgi:hypothetical protein